MKRHFFILAIAMVAVFSAAAQSGSTTLSMLGDQPPTDSDLVHNCRHLSLDVDANGFFLDAEYATPFAKGYSVAGFRLSPTLVYGINERAQLSVGLNASAFAGLDSLYRLRPTLSLLYKPTRWLTLVAGTLYGSHTHRLDAPVYDPSRWIFNYQEDGLQILTRTNRWYSDTWMDWTHYLTPWTPDQERFTMGTKHTLLIFNNKMNYIARDPEEGHIAKSVIRGWEITLPAHFLASHRGGEVKTIDTNTVTTFNECIGLHAYYLWGNNIQSKYHLLAFDLPFYFYHLEDRTLDHGGNALYPTVAYEYHRLNPDERRGWSLRAVAGYWHGDHYFSAMGSPQFWSANAYSALHIPPTTTLAEATDIRNIVTFSIAYEHQFKGLNLGLQADFYHDMDLGKTDLLVGFYMRFKERFILF